MRRHIDCRRIQHLDLIIFPDYVNRANPAGFHDSFDVLHRKPVFRPNVSLLRSERLAAERSVRALGSRLIEHPARLQLDILAIAVRKQFLPDHALPGKPPDPYLHAKLCLVVSDMGSAILVIMIESAIEVVILSQDVVRFSPSEIILLIPRDFLPILAYRIRVEVSAMSDVIRARESEFQITISMIPCVHPLVIWLVDGRIIMPCSFRGEICLVFFQPDFDSPQRASHQLVRRKPAAHAAITILRSTVIHGRGSGRSMTDDSEIKLDATRCPWPTHGYVPEFDGIVAVNELLPGFFIDSAPDLSADFRENI